ncbi:protein DpdF [Colwellia polaris]|jgi:ATP-dependent DNA helicase RecQ|uniref:protein DpdF n=1 Tax=Colwellia polaris TaxID=326537 RepID=UPI000A16CD16|nr:protein DpdF [Colwellia polaris]|tara:strand:+ start:2289 stop:4880 length:2592 start_codon:yes stop_codon:yes gene_type:complete
MDTDFNKLKKYFEGIATGIKISPPAFDISPYARLIKAIEYDPDLEVLTVQDLLILIRHALLYSLEKGIDNPSLTIPNIKGWPTYRELKQHSLVIVRSYSFGLLIKADKWLPTWLNDKDIFKRAFKEDNFREFSDIPIDPVLQKITGFSTFSSEGQKTVIRRVMNMNSGDTYLINLPTGSGKSLAFFTPALLNPIGSLVVVVIPTIALALDQERQFRRSLHRLEPHNNWNSKHFAWHSGLIDVDKAAIRQSINAGTQKILFCSPESIVGALRGQLFELAKDGLLSHFVVDEVHLLSGWGDEFRPAFQSLTSVWKGLLSNSPKNSLPKTLLLSATITSNTCDTIQSLFSHPSSKFAMLSSVFLRKEPDYWFHKCESEKLRLERVVECLMHSPRPAIVYVTKVADAEILLDIIKKSGISRAQKFTGATKTDEREYIISKWNKDELDVIVATSAFGVGMDKENVRTIIHACIPESIDRFYQEVGRGGRDGKGCTSLVLFCEDDWRVAQSLNRTTLISIEKGHKRWSKMWHSSQPIKNIANYKSNFYNVDLRVVPSHLEGGSDLCEAWNMRTLLLMARSGLINLQAPSPPDKADENDIDSLDIENVKAYYSRVVVEVLEGHLDKNIWHDKLDSYSNRSLETQKGELKRLRNILESTSEVGKELAFTYGFKAQNGLSGFTVDSTCGGCPICRLKENENKFIHSKAPRTIASNSIVLPNLENNLRSSMGISHFHNIWAVPFEIKDKPDELLVLLILALKRRKLINRVVVPDHWISFLQSEEKFEFRYCGYLSITRFTDWEKEHWDYPSGEAILLIPSDEADLQKDVLSKFPKLLWMLLSSKTKHLTHPERLFFDDFEFQISMNALQARLN